ncbi:hypothetical protein QFZ81_006162 [Paenibacillus sp. V4I9]|uniref:hypothetical protein n=1 Tax=unclassified Paenibacillus TaxID=185978 RepID=UPI00278209CD|nr:MULTISPECIES: hypothetical protein [unclassified Paenibacillus]MDQ0891074.1 hypothetical protein [Paenibacillus sp. V4I9]
MEKSNKGIGYLFLQIENDQANTHTMATLSHSLGERIIAKSVGFLSRPLIA